MNKFFLIIALIISISSCGFLDEDKEPEILLSKVDGQEYMADLEDSINSRKDTRFIEKGKFDLVKYESILNLADSLMSKNDEWRPRYYTALSKHLDFYSFNIDPKDDMRFGIGIFNYFVFYPKELIAQFNASTIDQIQFWNDQLGKEIQRKSQLENITEETIITLAQNNCKECTIEDNNLIKSMVEMLPMK